MVVSVSHLTDQVEIAGGGHAPILSGARGPAPPPSAGPRTPNPNTNPIPSLASDSYTSIPLGGYDEPFLFHWPGIFDLCTNCLVYLEQRSAMWILSFAVVKNLVLEVISFGNYGPTRLDVTRRGLI